MSPDPRRPAASRSSSSSRPSGTMSSGEYVALVVLLGAAIIGAAMFVTWAMEKRGILAPPAGPRSPFDEDADGTATPDV